MNPHLSLDRRRFLDSCMRGLLFAGLGGLTVVGETKRRRLANDPRCLRVWTCADCVEFGACAKPKAQDFRRGQPEVGGAGRSDRRLEAAAPDERSLPVTDPATPGR